MSEVYVCRVCGHRHVEWNTKADVACQACGRTPVTVEDDPKYVAAAKNYDAPAAPFVRTNFDDIAKASSRKAETAKVVKAVKTLDQAPAQRAAFRKRAAAAKLVAPVARVATKPKTKPKAKSRKR